MKFHPIHSKNNVHFLSWQHNQMSVKDFSLELQRYLLNRLIGY